MTSSLAAEPLLGPDGTSPLVESIAPQPDGNTLFIRLKPEARLADGSVLTPERLVEFLESQAACPVRVREAESGIEIRCETGLDPLLQFLKTRDLTPPRPVPWEALPTGDFQPPSPPSASESQAPIPLKAPPPQPGRLQARVLEVIKGEFPDIRLELQLEAIPEPPDTLPSVVGGRITAIPWREAPTPGLPAALSKEAVANLGAYFLHPGDIIEARFKETRETAGSMEWVITGIQRLPEKAPSEPERPNAFALIDKAEAHGRITAGEALEYKVWALFDPAKLPEPYRSDTPNRGATLFIKSIQQRWSDLDESTRVRLRPYLGPLQIQE